MRYITIITIILIILSVITGFLQHSNITESCTKMVPYLNETNNSTLYTFEQCYSLQSEGSFLGFMLFITFINIIVFTIKLISHGIDIISKKNKK